jgi:hypothetical protein
MIEFDHDLFQFILCDRKEFSIFVNILAEQSIHIFISLTLPGSIRMMTIQDLIVASRLQCWRFELHDQLLEYILVR